MEYSLKDLEKEYNLELDKIVSHINQQNPKTVLLQFPDGIKPYATTLADYIEKKTKTSVRIWLGSCFGACDTPQSDADLLIQFGHAEW